ncbi:MAG: efflux transporter outer membrane subunit [Kiritimatiellales bacterium]|nr:efflux transporter outer membrane subunit [Kiritimatiellota bacterium]MBL7012116.1 efflux transporter outer membrane subunit [Kiritimatiellales bacterium]
MKFGIQNGMALLAVLLCTSCARFAPDGRDFSADVPDQFSLYSESGMDVTNRWWESFQSLELNGLVDEVLSDSPSIQQSWARLAQAEAVATKSGAARWPSLDAAASGSSRQNMNTRVSTELYSLGLTASYELDLWGRVKSASEAAALDREVSREQLKTAAMTLASQTALRWSGIVSQKLQTELLRQQLEANRTSLELVELRFRKSQATALDVYQQRQTVAGTEARIPLAEMREQLLRNELAALLGRGDFQSLEVSTEKLPMVGALPAIGLPADVLTNRPDVRAAGLRLRSADWSVSAARADRLPAIRLSATAGYDSAEFADLFDDWYSHLIGSITGPIFEGGRRKAEVERTRAVVNERLAAYRETVLSAINEVEDALVSEQKQRDYIEALDRNLKLSRSSYNEALNRYRNGLSQYLPVLVELVGLQNLERDRVAAQTDLLQYRINLYRTLGGTWTDELKREDSK